MITQERLKELFFYQDGALIRRVSKGRSKKGADSGTIRSDLYRRICIDKHSYYAHRLVFLYFYGTSPEFEIDHIDGNKQNNKIENLRSIPRAENSQNEHHKRKNNSTGFKGVHYYKSKKLWTAKIVLNGKNYHLGYFKSPESASDAYLEKKKKIHPFYTG